MTRNRTLRRICIFAAAMSTFLGAAAASSEVRHARLVLDVKIESRGASRSALTGEQGTGRSSEALHTTVTLRPARSLERTNPNDRAAAGERLAKASREAEAKRPPREVIEARQRQLQADLRACGMDMACINRVSGAYSTESAAWTPKLAPETGERRYRRYSGHPGCESDLHARIQGSRQGTIPDVQGPVPFTEETHADYRAARDDKALLCGSFNDLVLDVKTDRIYVTIGQLPIKGTHTRIENGRSRVSKEGLKDVRLHADAMEWVRQQLQGVARTGSMRGTIEMKGQPGDKSTRSGTVEVELSWRFEDM